MANIKKLSDEEFEYYIVNKELEKYGVTVDDIKKLPRMPEDRSFADDSVIYWENWFQKYSFDSFEEFIAWKEYYFERYKDWKPKRMWRRSDVERHFNWHNMQIGLTYNYDFDEHMKRDKEIDMFKKVFGKNK